MIIDPNRRKEAEMKFYCGIHLHAKDNVLCVIDDTDSIQLREKVPNRVEAIVARLYRFCPRPVVVVEATLNWYWLGDGSPKQEENGAQSVKLKTARREES